VCVPRTTIVSEKKPDCDTAPHQQLEMSETRPDRGGTRMYASDKHFRLTTE
jgi:hypothetical protein